MAPKEELGPLADLIGTWTGSNGVNVISVPKPGAPPDAVASFKLLVRPYREVLTFSNTINGAVPNRGGDVNQHVGAITYVQEVYATDGQKEQLHVENGMYLYLVNKVDVAGDGTTSKFNGDTPFAIARNATIPHGNSIAILGNYKVEMGPPKIPEVSTKPANAGKVGFGYFDTFLHGFPAELNVSSPT
jgi:hypothetical protein